MLFALVAEAVGWATAALLDQDVERANQVIANDRDIDERCEELAGLVKERLGGATLLPEELEDLIAVLQIVPELERSADLAEHIAQRALRSLGGTITPRSRGLIQRMSDVAIGMWQAAGNAYRQRSRDASFGLNDADDELDELATNLVAEGVRSGADPQVAVDLALIARFYERLGDHAVNLASRVETMGRPRRLGARRLGLHRRWAAPPAPGEKRGWARRALHGLTRFRLVPTDEGFFDLFQSAAANCRDCADAVAKLIASIAEPGEQFEQVKACELRGDALIVDLLRRLDASFVTPYDREDIHALAEELDDVIDDMVSAASLMELVPEGEPLPELGELGDTMVATADVFAALIDCLRTGTGGRFRLERIEHLKRQGDAISRRAMGRLFSGEFEALDVIKWKDVIEALDKSLDAFEDASDVVEGILVKNS